MSFRNSLHDRFDPTGSLQGRQARTCEMTWHDRAWLLFLVTFWPFFLGLFWPLLASFGPFLLFWALPTSDHFCPFLPRLSIFSRSSPQWAKWPNVGKKVEKWAKKAKSGQKWPEETDSGQKKTTENGQKCPQKTANSSQSVGKSGKT